MKSLEERLKYREKNRKEEEKRQKAQDEALISDVGEESDKKEDSKSFGKDSDKK